MFKQAIYLPGDSPGIPAYSPAVAVDLGERKIIYLTGQIPVDKDGRVVAPGDAAAQAEYAFQLAEKVLNQAGSSLKDVVKAQIFLTNVDDFAQIAPVRNKYFAENRPASTVVEINRGTTPGCLVELDFIAIC